MTVRICDPEIRLQYRNLLVLIFVHGYKPGLLTNFPCLLASSVVLPQLRLTKMSTRPRPPPILKQYEAPPESNPFALCPRVVSPHVHFPSTPTLVSTYATFARAVYDRTPLTISPNTCALPGRGERTYNSYDTPVPLGAHLEDSIKGSYFHPRAYEACEQERLDFLASPSSPSPLVYDSSSSSPSCSSESDESDVAVLTPPDTSAYGRPQAAIHIPGSDVLGMSHSPITRKCSQETLGNALAFLPYPPELSLKDKPRIKRPTSSTTLRRKNSHRQKVESNFNGYSSFSAPSLDGCLGGF